jgi:hypothetical protein
MAVSGPVRVGNCAWDQPQLDVYELLNAAFRLRQQLGAVEPATRTFLIALADADADAAASQWQQPDWRCTWMTRSYHLVLDWWTKFPSLFRTGCRR